jgi:hypothetical protein
VDEIVKVLSSPAWWISVVVVGIAVNIVSAYLKPYLDSRLSRFSGWWRVRSEKQKALRRATIDRLRRSEHEQLLASLDDLRDRSRSLYMLVFGVFMMLLQEWLNIGSHELVRIFVLAIAGISFFVSYFMFISAARLNGLLNASRCENGAAEPRDKVT